MNRLALIVSIATTLVGCSKSQQGAGSAAPKDAVEQKLVEVAGNGATNCGRFPVQTADVQLKSASDCALDAAQNRKAFYIGYDMPGMTVAVAGDSTGKLYSVQVQERGGVTSEPCPSELRVAPSGRVTCFAPGKFGGSGNPHGGMPMPGGGGGMMNPHAVIPPAGSGTPNPHEGAGKTPKQQ